MSEPSDEPRPSITRAWETWAAENLLRGVRRDVIVDRLLAEGVPRELALSLLDGIEASPIFRAAKPFARDARRGAMHAKLRRAMARAAHDPTGVTRRANVSAAELRDDYVAASQPVILTDVVRRWPALDRWTPRALAERFGDEVVDVTVDRESDPDYDRNAAAHTIAMPLRDLVARVEAAERPTNDVYLIARGRAVAKTGLRALIDEVVIPDGYLAMERAVACAALWIGPAGTVTPLHHDTSNILFCQVHGRKRWKLIAPWEGALLDDARSLYGGRDPEKDDLGDVIVKDVVLEPGETLFVPVGWWHHVRALDASVSLAFNNFGFENDLEWYRPGQIR